MLRGPDARNTPDVEAMANVNRFENLIAWQKARELTTELYGMTQTGALARDFGLAAQLHRAAVWVMANIAEGYDRGNRAEFSHLLFVAGGSCAELRSHLYVARHAGDIDREAFVRLMDRADEPARILAGLRSSVARQRDQHKDEA